MRLLLLLFGLGVSATVVAFVVDLYTGIPTVGTLATRLWLPTLVLGALAAGDAAIRRYGPR